MRISARFYGILEDLVGRRTVSLQIEGNCIRAEDLFSLLLTRYPKAKNYLLRSIMVKDDRVVKRSECIYDGEEISVLPPGSGG